MTGHLISPETDLPGRWSVRTGDADVERQRLSRAPQTLYRVCSTVYVRPPRSDIVDMGICIGMQTLFEGSDEAPEEPGLGILPGHVKAFDSSSKSVPHMGWNGATPLKSSAPDDRIRFGIEDGSDFYFVHSYRVACASTDQDAILAATRYGDETFVSAVQYRNIFATQFHPEKSGEAGLRLLQAWLGASGPINPASIQSVPAQSRALDIARRGLAKRIVACLDVRANDAGDLVVTKGDQYDVRETTGKAVRNLGRPVDLAKRYYADGADEICLLNITSFRNSPLRDQPMLEVVRKAAKSIFVPLTIGGGIKDFTDPDGTPRSALEVASAYFRAGADKVSIGGDAVLAVEELLETGTRSGKTGIETISTAYGRQAVVVSIDPKRVYADALDDIPLAHRPSAVNLLAPPLPSDPGPDGERFCWWQCTVQGGRAVRDIDVVQLAQGAESLGAGEILLNSVDRDGSKRGFDARLVQLVRSSVSIPVVASSGAGAVVHFSELFERTGVEAALAAGIFHRREVPLQEVKKHLLEHGTRTRLEEPNVQ